MKKAMRLLLLAAITLIILLLCLDENARTRLSDQIQTRISEMKQAFKRPMSPSELRIAQKEWQRFWMVDQPSYIMSDKQEGEMPDYDD